MLFNSFEFLFAFLPITFFVYFFLLHKRLIVASKSFLVFASLFFYAWWNIAYLPIILSSLLFNFVVGNALSTEKVKINKKSLLIFGIISNIILLGYFKYVDFFIDNLNYVFDSNITTLNLLLPLAISFFTFQQITYLVDSYKKETTEYDFLNYALFVTFFPQLIAGPIVHHREMMPQFSLTRNLTKRYKNIVLGLFVFSIGLFKKVVIADTFAVWANNGFDKAETLNMIEAWIASLSYTFQLYFDFSGYADMAIGIALLFNIKLPANFNSPYKAKNIQDFWRRWHITLSRFLKDYIYIPLGGNRDTKFRLYSNLLITFLLGGLWHGAAWTFVFWGFLHAVALIVHRIWQQFNIKLNNIVAWFITFNFINISWVFFRAEEWNDAIKVLNGMFFGTIVLPQKMAMFSINGIEYNNAWLFNIYADKYALIEVVVALIFVLSMKNSMELRDRFYPNGKNVFFTIVLIIGSFLFLSRVHEFLYFNF